MIKAPARLTWRTVMLGAPTTTSPSPSPSKSPTASAAPNSDDSQSEMFLVDPHVNDVTSEPSGSEPSEQSVPTPGWSVASLAASNTYTIDSSEMTSSSSLSPATTG